MADCYHVTDENFTDDGGVGGDEDLSWFDGVKTVEWHDRSGFGDGFTVLFGGFYALGCEESFEEGALVY